MTVLDFSNSVDELTKDFIKGVTDERTFKSGIMELLLKVAAPRLEPNETPIEESPEYEFVINTCQSSNKGESDFFTLSDLEMYFIAYYKNKILPSPKRLGRVLQKLNYERTLRRKASVPVYGYWMKRIV